MSEYQYYEFQAVDQPLTERQMVELRKWSTRAEITPTSFINEYHWGDFRGEPRRIMAKYFDAFVYWANWGSRWFMLRLPREAVDVKAMKPYAAGEGISLRSKGKYVLVEFHSEDEEGAGDEESGTNWMAALLPLREQLLSGDLRSLYLGWLSCAQAGELEDDAPEPPVPAGLGKLSLPLKRLVSFLRIEDKLLRAAAAADAGQAPAEPSGKDLTNWIGALPEQEKNRLLLRVAEGEAAQVGRQLLQQFRRACLRKNPPKRGVKGLRPRTVSELLASRSRAKRKPGGTG